MSKRRILLVQVDAPVVDELRYHLERLDFEFAGAVMTMAEAVPVIRSTPSVLVVMDDGIRGREEGRRSADQLRHQLGVPVLLLTASLDGTQGLRHEPGRAGDELVRPFTLEVLRVALERAWYRHEAAAKWRRMEPWLATTLTSIGDAVIAVDIDRRIDFFNAAAERLTGWSRDEAIGCEYADVARIVSLTPGDVPADPVGEAFRAGVAQPLVDGFAVRRPDGAIVPVTHHAVPIRANDSDAVTGVVLIVRDASAEEKAERDRRALERKMQEAQRLESLGVLAGGVAHDFNNLLTAIIGNTEIAEMDLPPQHPMLEPLDAVKRAARRAADLCRQMLAYAGEGSYHPNQLNLTTLVRDTATLLRVAIGNAGQLRFELMEDIPVISADATQVQQVLMNLVTNAAEAFNGPSEGAITVRTGFVHRDDESFDGAVVVPSSRANAFVFLEVGDAAGGIAPESLVRIWDPFYTTKLAGRGLGLSAVHGIVRTAGGGLAVESRPGSGTTFRVYLPAVDSPLRLARSASDGSPGAANQAGGWILIIDDEEPIRKLLEHTVKSLGYDGVAVGNVEAALAAVQISPGPRVVLLDATMRGVDTAALAAKLQSHQPGLPLVLMSGYVEAQATARYKEIPFAAFLQKPFTREHVAAMLAQIQAGSGV